MTRSSLLLCLFLTLGTLYGENSELSGEFRWLNRYAIDPDNPSSDAIDSIPELDIRYETGGRSARLYARGEIYQDAQDESPEGALEELYLRLGREQTRLYAGLMKRSWGAGEEEHVVDVLTVSNGRSSPLSSYEDRRRGVPMLLLETVANQGRLELVYIPVLIPNGRSESSRWQDTVVRRIGELSLPVDEEETDDLQHSQLAVRYSRSLGAADLAALYYLGFYKDPTIDESESELRYDPVNMIGLEAKLYAGPAKLLAELGYFTTQDFQGDDPDLRNSELRWLGGFDYALPFSRASFSLQETGRYLFYSDEIDADPDDLQRNEPVHRNRLILRIRDEWNRSRILPQIGAFYGLERQDWALRPELTIHFREDIFLSLEAELFEGSDEGYYGQYDENDSVTLSLGYLF